MLDSNSTVNCSIGWYEFKTISKSSIMAVLRIEKDKDRFYMPIAMMAVLRHLRQVVQVQ